MRIYGIPRSKNPQPRVSVQFCGQPYKLKLQVNCAQNSSVTPSFFGRFQIFIRLGITKSIELAVMHQSIPAVPIHPSNRGAFAHVVCPGIGYWQFYCNLGAGHLCTLGRPLGIWHTGIWKCHGWVYRERQGICRIMAHPSGTRETCTCFLNFRYFFQSLLESSMRQGELQCIFYINKTITDVNTTISHSKLAKHFLNSWKWSQNI